MSKMRKRQILIGAILGAAALIAGVQMARRYFEEEERAARTRLREALISAYPETVRTLRTHYGLRAFAPDPGRPAGPAVVLVHGLDDPGKVWMNLAPALVREGFAVWILKYPNDQPVAASARFFRERLLGGGPPPHGTIAIVAHSMGGLVAREMLTAPGLDYLPLVRAGKLPGVRQLIMVGTPNHGSELARFRGFTELRDQWANLFLDDYHWMAGIVDGTGEAGIDLIPGSRFLVRLNARPHPHGVRLAVIAGVMRPGRAQAIETRARELTSRLPAAAQEAARQVADGLVAASEQVGDGLVAVKSARLDGVPLITVPGTHLSMIRNLSAESTRIPPAIPVVLTQLRSTGGEG